MKSRKFDFNSVFALMQEAFPKSEYRNYEKQKHLLDNPHYKILPYFDENNQLLAFAAIWVFNSFTFVEHIAVSKLCRGMGIGSKIMRDIIQNSKDCIVLEIEPPIDEITTKRLHFYEKLEFKMNDYQYFQPPLNQNGSPMPLKILSYPKKLSKTEFEEFKNTIYSNVYNQN